MWFIKSIHLWLLPWFLCELLEQTLLHWEINSSIEYMRNFVFHHMIQSFVLWRHRFLFWKFELMLWMKSGKVENWSTNTLTEMLNIWKDFKYITMLVLKLSEHWKVFEWKRCAENEENFPSNSSFYCKLEKMVEW